MSAINTVKPELVEMKSLKNSDTEHSIYDKSSSDLLLRDNFEDFDIEAQPSRYHPSLGDKLSTTFASIREIQIQESATYIRLKFSNVFGPCLALVRMALQKLLYVAVALAVGALGVVVAWTVLIGISIVIGKLAVVAIWIWKKIGLI